MPTLEKTAVANDLPQFRSRSVTIWICLDADGNVGLWYADEALAMKQRGLWQAIFPVDLPAAIYSGFPVACSRVVRNDGEPVERPTRRETDADEGTGQPTTQNVGAVDLECSIRPDESFDLRPLMLTTSCLYLP
jgi:hypothetical protein